MRPLPTIADIISRAPLSIGPDPLWAGGEVASLPAGPELDGNIAVDVAIIGGGFTGLWTAYFLKAIAPCISVAVFEAHECGAGASGRNGGWLMGSVEGLERFRPRPGAPLEHGIVEQLRLIVPEVSRIVEDEAINCDLAHGGGVFAAARQPQQQQRATKSLRALRSMGFSHDDYRWLGPDELQALLNVHNALGGVITPHVATLNPWKLVRGLARAVSHKGVAIYEHSPVQSVKGRQLRIGEAQVIAERIIFATEGYSGKKNPLQKLLLPVQSGMIATEPLSDQQWSELGFPNREGVCDFSRQSTYLQRTADNRLVIGARGRYQLGGGEDRNLTPETTDSRRRAALALDLFPSLKNATITHAWSGTLAVPRAMSPHVVFDEKSGRGTAGGYLGEGVGASFLFGRTLAELIAGQDSLRTSMPWVYRGNFATLLTAWEPEPLPWLGFNATMMLHDLEEASLRRRPGGLITRCLTRLCDAGEALLGGH